MFLIDLFMTKKKGGTSSIVQEAVGQTMTLREFRNVLTRAAINLFPDQDAFCYTEGLYLFL